MKIGAKKPRRLLSEKVLPRERGRFILLNKWQKSVRIYLTRTLALLNEAIKYFDSKAKIDACPLCESSENVAGLAEKVSNLLTTYASLSKAEQEFQSAKKQSEDQETKV